MTTETRKRIRAYKRMLPELRERVIAVALLLAMSVSMLGTASYAWLTLSRNPEIRGMNSTVAANGNLEIALVTGDGSKAPNESEIGDSSAREGQTVKAANITWGNLVNLADASYGLENLTLRPAQLNSNALLESPLSAADYTKDGRVQRLTTNFKYTSWTIPDDPNKQPYFGLAESMGVRAVSSTSIQDNTPAGQIEKRISEVNDMNVTARSAFTAITQNQEWMNSLGTMMSVHMNANLNTEPQYTNATVDRAHVENLLEMYKAFSDAFEAELNALTGLVNLELYFAHGHDTTKYVDKTKDDILTAIPNPQKTGTRDYIAATVTGEDGTEKVVRITNLENFIYNYNMLKEDTAELERILAAGNFQWVDSGLNKVILHLVVLDDCLIQFGTDAPKTIKAFIAEFNSASGMDVISLGLKYNGKACNAIITNGILYDFEKRVASDIVVKDISKNKGLALEAKVYSSSRDFEAKATVYATITTSAEDPYLFDDDLAYAKSLNTGAGAGVGDVTAMDTYGLVIDLWTRTNADNSYLMLEGNVLTKEKEQVVQRRDAEGNLVDIYKLDRSITVEEEDGTTQTYTDSYELYKKESGNTVTWYNANTYAVFELQEGDAEPTKMMEVIHEVIGYEGENRVWTEEVSPLLTTDATTQGSGSCYVFYADTPQDQTQSLELLRAMRVAFIDANGELLATARMDSDKAYEDSGRVTVPLVMDTRGVVLGTDAAGNTIRAIAPLEANVPFRISALVYLDGSTISNEHVLAASDIQGQLNIQFGSSANLMAVNDTELEAEIRRVSASIDNTHFDFDNATGDMITNVTLNVEGSEPETVTASFIRKINATQGSRETAMVFTNNGNGVWTSSYKFLTPGNYELRTVRLDGVDYDLSGTLPAVTVEGFALEYIMCHQGKNYHRMTASGSQALNLSLKFQTNDPAKLPKTVTGYYVRDDGYQTNVNFTMNSSTQEWTGVANFLMSGEYTLKYLELDGEFYPLAEDNYQFATLYLGMYVEVLTTSPSDPNVLVFDGSTTAEEKNLKMQVRLLDNSGEEKMGEDNVTLFYQQRNGSRTLSGDLTWNPRTGYYEGNMPAIYYGKFQFSKLTVNGDPITMASRAPTFTIMSPDPTEYAGFGRQTTVYAPNGDATLNIRLTNGATAVASALIADQAGNEHTVRCELGTEAGDDLTQFNFLIPNNSSGSQDGTWTLLEAQVWNAFGENGHEYTEEAPLVIDLRGENNSVKVTHKINANFAANQGKDFSGVFMQTHDVSGVRVNIVDAAGNMVDVNGDGTCDISNVKIIYEYKGDAKAKGGYEGIEGTSTAPVDTIFTLELESTDGKTFIQKGTQTVQLAGTYAPREFSFVVYDGTKYITRTFKPTETATWPANVPTFTVSSPTPTVTVSEITPKGEINTKITWTKNWRGALNYTLGDKKTNGIDTTTNTVTAYAQAVTSGGVSVGNGDAGFIHPKVKFTVAGVDAKSTVKFTIPAGNAKAIEFSKTGNGQSNEITLGAHNPGIYSSWSLATYTVHGYLGHGNQTIRKITIVWDNNTFTVDLDKPVVIVNPSSIDKTS